MNTTIVTIVFLLLIIAIFILILEIIYLKKIQKRNFEFLNNRYKKLFDWYLEIKQDLINKK